MQSHAVSAKSEHASKQPTTGSKKQPPNKRGRRFAHHLRHLGQHKTHKPADKKQLMVEMPKEPAAKKTPAALEGESRPNEMFSPVPSVLLQPGAAPTAADVATVGSGAERAQAAALAERLVQSIRIVDLGKERYQVQVRIAGVGGRGGIEVELQHDRGELSAVLKPDADAVEDAGRLVETFRNEAARRGLQFETIEIEY